MNAMTTFESKIFYTLQPSLNHLGYNVVRVKNLGGNKNKPNIQIMVEYIDNTSNISHEDCKKISLHSSELLSVNDVIEKEYNLEVSSPGIERPLFDLQDFNDPRFVDKKVFVKLNRLIEEPLKIKNFKAILKGFSKDNKIIFELYEQNSINLEIDFEDIRSANLHFDYKELLNKREE